MKISFVDIENHLIQNNLEFKLLGNEKKEYTITSIDHPIDNGFYFIEGVEINQNFSNSLILTSNKIDPINNNVFIRIKKSPQVIYYQILNELYKEVSTGEICDSSKIHREAIIGKNVQIDSFVVIGKCVIGDNSIIRSNTVISDNCVIGNKSVVESNCTIGTRGIAWVFDRNGERINQPQLGGVLIGNKCIIGSNSAIVRGSLNENTIIGSQTVIAPGAKVGHGAVIGEKVHLSNNVCIAGNAKIGDKSFLGSGAIISSRVVIKSGTIVGAGAMVNKNFDIENATLIGIPAKPIKDERNKSQKGIPSTLRNKKDEK